MWCCAVALGSTGCSSSQLAGRPERPYTAEQLVEAYQAATLPANPTYADRIVDLSRQYYNSTNPLRKKQIRNRLIGQGMDQNRAYYEMFLDEFSKNAKLLGAGSDIASVVLDVVAASVTPPGTKSILALSSAAVTASGSTINEQFFYKQTIPVLLRQMESSRAEVRTEILSRQRLSAEEYPLTWAMSDLARLYIAGTIDGAMAEIQKNASVQQVEAEAQASQIFANADPEARRYRQSISAWLSPQSGAPDTKRLELLRQYVQNRFQADLFEAWLVSAPTAQLKQLTLVFGIPTLTDEQIAARAQVSIKAVEKSDRILAARVAAFSAWAGQDQSAVVAWLGAVLNDNQMDGVALFVVRSIAYAALVDMGLVDDLPEDLRLEDLSQAGEFDLEKALQSPVVTAGALGAIAGRIYSLETPVASLTAALAAHADDLPEEVSNVLNLETHPLDDGGKPNDVATTPEAKKFEPDSIEAQTLTWLEEDSRRELVRRAARIEALIPMPIDTRFESAALASFQGGIELAGAESRSVSMWLDALDLSKQRDRSALVIYVLNVIPALVQATWTPEFTERVSAVEEEIAAAGEVSNSVEAARQGATEHFDGALSALSVLETELAEIPRNDESGRVDVDALRLLAREGPGPARRVVAVTTALLELFFSPKPDDPQD